MNPKPVIAILGATSHVACGLIDRFLRTESAQLVLFGRSCERIRTFLDSIGGPEEAEIVEGYDSFDSGRYDVVINCVGAGAPGKLGEDRSIWFTLTEEFDNLVLNYLKTRNPVALYINFSSGAVYGRGGDALFRKEDELCLRVNDLPSSDYYTIARIHSEAKHRSLAGLQIVDLRIFSYFSRFADLASGYFMTDVLKALLTGTPFGTDDSDMVRDYIAPDDLYRMIRLCMERKRINAALDSYSLRPVSKSQVLARFQERFGLLVERTEVSASPNGTRSVYASANREAEHVLGYHPQYSSLQTLEEETVFMLEKGGISL